MKQTVELDWQPCDDDHKPEPKRMITTKESEDLVGFSEPMRADYYTNCEGSWAPWYEEDVWSYWEPKDVPVKLEDIP